MTNSPYNYATRLMGTECTVTLISDSKEKAHKTYIDVITLAKEKEKRFSRFKISSELSQINAKKTNILSPEFREAFIIAQSLYNETQGLYNPLVQISTHGYDRSFEKIRQSSHRSDKLHEKKVFSFADYDFSQIKFNNKQNTITLTKNQRLDFGGFLKCHTTEIMADHASKTCKGVIINIGGDITTRGRDENNKKFIFEILNPITHKEISLPLANHSLATSGTYRRVWKIKNKTIHHILDPRTNKNPQNNLISASTIHKKGSRADAFSKTALILGKEKTEIFFNKKHIPYILIDKHGTIFTNIKNLLYK